MRTRIDAAGRLVIPQGLRTSVGLGEGGDVDVSVVGAGILIEPVAGHDLVREGDLIVIPDDGPAMDDDSVRELRLGDQR